MKQCELEARVASQNTAIENLRSVTQTMQESCDKKLAAFDDIRTSLESHVAEAKHDVIELSDHLSVSTPLGPNSLSGKFVERVEMKNLLAQALEAALVPLAEEFTRRMSNG